jgi:hypothetical protein
MINPINFSRGVGKVNHLKIKLVNPLFFMGLIVFILLLVTPVLSWADRSTDVSAQILRLESELVRVQQDLQATFQQFQMIQELRRNETQSAPATAISRTPDISVPVPKYDDMVENIRHKDTRIKQYTAELDDLYVYYKDLEEKRRSLVAEIDYLKQNLYQEEE